jgi:hypothetical protein
MMFSWDWRAGAAFAGVLSGGLLLAITAQAADLSTKAFPAPGCPVDDKTLYGGQGSVAVPLGCGYGLQADGLAGSFGDNSIYAVGGHLFWRNPSSGLLGLYGSYQRWDQFSGVNVNHIAPEAELYFGGWTFQGIAGVEFGNSASGQLARAL